PYLRHRTWAGALMAVGHLTFATLLFLNVFHWGRRGVGPTLFTERPAPAGGAAAPATAGAGPAGAGGRGGQPARQRYPGVGLAVFRGCAGAWLALVLAPYLQLGGLQPAAAEAGEAAYPRPLGGAAARGRDVYRANGCLYCHSQQVRPEGFGADIKRGWGTRR